MQLLNCDRTDDFMFIWCFTMSHILMGGAGSSLECACLALGNVEYYQITILHVSFISLVCISDHQDDYERYFYKTNIAPQLDSIKHELNSCK